MWHKNRHFQLINDKIHNKMKKMRAASLVMATLESMYSTRYRPHPTSKLPASFAEMQLMSPMN